MGNLDFATFNSKLLKSSHFPDSLFELRKKLIEDVKPEMDLSAQDLKNIIERMEMEKDEEKQLFVQLLSYYYIEQFALCGTKLNNPRHRLWKYVSDMEEFNKVDWPTFIHEHLMTSISEAHGFVSGGKEGQYTFRGCAPILEAILFERLPTLYSGSKSSDLPLVQSYNAQRKNVEEWKVKILQCEVNACEHCCPSPADAPLSTPHGDAPPSTPPHTPIPSLSPPLEEAYEAIDVGLSALKLNAEEGEGSRERGARGRRRGRGRGGRGGQGKEREPLNYV
ncbi:hypothetical protein POM88_019425 [Heracleum sosnowskyi]|uniref:Uncharacterized protein n=1 Tax=Heracleum sosnowskyi TaxID=360622 RepID=A0AAD8MMA1_9APIA|nr:hypothetical protein POM88_019425 [Heracleum sosnowskyi]